MTAASAQNSAAKQRTNTALGPGGKALWSAITRQHKDLDAAQKVQLLEACRAKDRLDKLDAVLSGDAQTWLSLDLPRGTPAWEEGDDTITVEVSVDQALSAASTQANLLKQLLAAIRLPDAETGKKPQRRGARGAQAPTVPGGSSRDRLRAV